MVRSKRVETEREAELRAESDAAQSEQQALYGEGGGAGTAPEGEGASPGAELPPVALTIAGRLRVTSRLARAVEGLTVDERVALVQALSGTSASFLVAMRQCLLILRGVPLAADRDRIVAALTGIVGNAEAPGA
jgi:hypothetical protein